MTDIAIRRAIIVGALSLCVAAVFSWSSIGTITRAFGGGDPWVDASAPASIGQAAVVVELFTSEGCSSCPPADEVLSRLVREPLNGTVVLGLGEHVDYWDRLGWRDPFSSPVFSSRQADYQSHVFRTGSVYTPQLVVDGRFEAVGSDVSAIRRAIADAAKAPKAAVAIDVRPIDDAHITVHLTAQIPATVVVEEQLEVLVALVQDRLTTDVQRGENRGRRLAHSAVVRSLSAVAVFKPPVRSIDTTATLSVAAGWNLHDMRIVGFLQERQSRRIVGAGAAPRG